MKKFGEIYGCIILAVLLALTIPTHAHATEFNFSVHAKLPKNQIDVKKKLF
ncbi:hypothetical protein [Listeria floridensis]|uniref:hypothetical protein n=1 Tax=Listeria floridensis TaxID=1494962 RepID=UPI0019D38748|nr:hypothetical protein [Listeria floridensis]